MRHCSELLAKASFAGASLQGSRTFALDPMAASQVPSTVAVHPLVLLSVVDHFNRACKGTNKRAVGVLLGHVSKGNKVSCTNSFAVPFEEDDRDPTVWFLDHNYLENMIDMFRKVNAREKIVGWYSTGPKICVGDLDVNELIRSYCENPALVIIDVKPKDLGLPTEAYISVEEPREDGAVVRTFEHLPSEINAADAEEVGVGHLLRDIQDGSVSSLTTEVISKLAALKSLHSRLSELHKYLVNVAEGRLPVNNEIMYKMQDVFNLLPSLNISALVKAFYAKTNDIMLILYVSALIRSIIALHDLVDNKLELKLNERKAADLAAASSIPPVHAK
jgi:26S proteasome regulatory subunit N8